MAYAKAPPYFHEMENGMTPNLRMIRMSLYFES